MCLLWVVGVAQWTQAYNPMLSLSSDLWPVTLCFQPTGHAAHGLPFALSKDAPRPVPAAVCRSQL